MYTFVMKLLHNPNLGRGTLIRNVVLLDICDERIMEELEAVSKEFKLLAQYECQDKKSKGAYCRAIMEIVDDTDGVIFPSTEYFLSRECKEALREIVDRVDAISIEHLGDISEEESASVTEKIAEGGFAKKNGNI